MTLWIIKEVDQVSSQGSIRPYAVTQITRWLKESAATVRGKLREEYL